MVSQGEGWGIELVEGLLAQRVLVMAFLLFLVGSVFGVCICTFSGSESRHLLGFFAALWAWVLSVLIVLCVHAFSG